MLCDVGQYLTHVSPEMLFSQIDNVTTLKNLHNVVDKRIIQVKDEMYQRELLLILDYFGCSENDLIKEFSKLVEGMPVIIVYTLKYGINKCYCFNVCRLKISDNYFCKFETRNIKINKKNIPKLETTNLSITNKAVNENHCAKDGKHNIKCDGGDLVVLGVYQLQEEKLNNIKL